MGSCPKWGSQAARRPLPPNYHFLSLPVRLQGKDEGPACCPDPLTQNLKVPTLTFTPSWRLCHSHMHHRPGLNTRAWRATAQASSSRQRQEPVAEGSWLLLCAWTAPCRDPQASSPWACETAAGRGAAGCVGSIAGSGEQAAEPNAGPGPTTSAGQSPSWAHEGGSSERVADH